MAHNEKCVAGRGHQSRRVLSPARRGPLRAGCLDKRMEPVLAGPAANPLGVDWFAVVFGLGFVLSFGYWCTNFLVVQRAMAARNMTAARNTPLIATVPKMLFPLLVILPGMIAIALASMPNKDYRIPPPIFSNDQYAKAVEAFKSAGSSERRSTERSLWEKN